MATILTKSHNEFLKHHCCKSEHLGCDLQPIKSLIGIVEMFDRRTVDGGVVQIRVEQIHRGISLVAWVMVVV